MLLFTYFFLLCTNLQVFWLGHRLCFIDPLNNTEVSVDNQDCKEFLHSSKFREFHHNTQVLRNVWTERNKGNKYVINVTWTSFQMNLCDVLRLELKVSSNSDFLRHGSRWDFLQFIFIIAENISFINFRQSFLTHVICSNFVNEKENCYHDICSTIFSCIVEARLR